MSGLRRAMAALGQVAVILHADSAFWSRAVGDWPLARGLSFVLAMPLHPDLDLPIHLDTLTVPLVADGLGATSQR